MNSKKETHGALTGQIRELIGIHVARTPPDKHEDGQRYKREYQWQ